MARASLRAAYVDWAQHALSSSRVKHELPAAAKRVQGAPEVPTSAAKSECPITGREQLLALERLEAVEVLVTDVAHELVNLLTVIGAGLYLASQSPEERQRGLDLAQGATDHAAVLVAQLNAKVVTNVE